MTTSELFDSQAVSDTGEAIAAGMHLAEPHPINTAEGRFHAVLKPSGAEIHLFDTVELEQRLALHPLRAKGSYSVVDPGSFIAYMEKHAGPESEMWADPKACRIVGVINAHAGATLLPGHGDHRVTLGLVTSHQWQVWTAQDGKWLERQAFAEFIEDNAIDVVTPDSATMVEVAEGFHASTSAEFKDAQRLTSGEVKFRYEETINAAAGHNGELEVPTEFTLAIPIFEGTDPIEVRAKFRYRLRTGNVTLGFKLERPYDLIRGAFQDAANVIDDSLPNPMFIGASA